MKKRDKESIIILLVEDNEGDARLTREAFRDAEKKVDLHHVIDGLSALEYLDHENEFTEENAHLPDIILLDLNMPRMDGREFMEEIKKRPEFIAIPIIVLTTSNNQNDIDRSYNLNANCYMTKSINFDEFKEMMLSFQNFWFNNAYLPRR